MKKNKKGFTLIELLAVIVILGIIMTIVVSNVVKYINKAKAGAYVDTYEGIVKNIQTLAIASELPGADQVVSCNDEGSTKCYNQNAYKDIYSSKDIKLQVSTSSGISITVKPNPNGTYKNVTSVSSGNITHGTTSGNTISVNMSSDGTYNDSGASQEDNEDYEDYEDYE